MRVPCADDSIAQELENKDTTEVKNYAAKFWELGPSRLSNWDTVEKQIEKGEGKIQKRQECMNAVCVCLVSVAACVFHVRIVRALYVSVYGLCTCICECVRVCVCACLCLLCVLCVACVWCAWCASGTESSCCEDAGR